MKDLTTLTMAALFFLVTSPSFAEQMDVAEYVTAPGGKVTYYIVSGKAKEEGVPPPTAIVSRKNNENKVILQEKENSSPEKNLTGFYNLHLSTDASKLYFNSIAWAVSGAVHSLDIATGSVKFITAGELACVVLSGEYQGNLIVSKHKYFVQGGSHDDLYLVDIEGKEKGLVAQGTDKTKVCPTLGL